MAVGLALPRRRLLATLLTGLAWLPSVAGSGGGGDHNNHNTRCQDIISTSTACVDLTGCVDCPCKWVEVSSTVGVCRTCVSEDPDTDCPQDDTSSGAEGDSLKTAAIVVGIIFFCIAVTCCVIIYLCKNGGVQAVLSDKKGKPMPARFQDDGPGGSAKVAVAPAPSGPGPAPAPVGASADHKPADGPPVPPPPQALRPVVLPPYWTTRSGIHVVQNPDLLEHVQRLMERTWEAKFTRDRRLADSKKVPTGCRVVNVLRVEHHKSFTRYCGYRDGIAAKGAEVGGIPPFDLATDNVLNTQFLVGGVNEAYLFHGTNPQAAEAIAKDDFDMQRAGSARGTMFGPGIYLAENSSKSDEYAKEGDGVYQGLCAMLICRAVPGRVCTVYQAGDHSGAVRSGEYDSVCGDRRAAVGTFREMVFFAAEAVYTEYIAIYARTYAA